MGISMKIHVNNKGVWLGRFVLYLNGDKYLELIAREDEDIFYEFDCLKGDTLSLECEELALEDDERHREIDDRRERKKSGEEDAMYSIGDSRLFYSPFPYITVFEVVDPNQECELVFKELTQRKGLYYITTEAMNAVKAKRLILREECNGKQLSRQFLRSIGSGFSLFPIFVGIPVGVSILFYILMGKVSNYYIQTIFAIPSVLLLMVGIFMAIGGFHLVGEAISEYQFLRDNPMIRLDGGKKEHNKYKGMIDFYIDR